MKPNLGSVSSEITELLERLRALVSAALAQSMKAFEDFNSELAEETMAGFIGIEKSHSTIEDIAFGAISTYQPQDIDLRRLIAYIHTSNGLYSVGRLAQKIMEIVASSETLDHFKDLESLPYLSELAGTALAIAVRAVLKEDLSELDELEKLEALCDNETSEMFQEIADYLSRHRDISIIAMLYVIVGRYYERAADHAISIAESAVYLVTGERKKLGLAYEGIDDISDLVLDV